MLVRVCPVCETERPQTEIFCERRDDAGEQCCADLLRQPLIAAGTSTAQPLPLPPAPPRPERWICAKGHDAAPGDTLCWCGELVHPVPEENFPQGDDAPDRGFGESEQLPLAPLEPAQTLIGAWLVAGVDLEAALSEGPHRCHDDDGREGELRFSGVDLIVALAAVCPDRMRAIIDHGDWQARQFVVLEALPDADNELLDQQAIHSLVAQIGPVLDRLHRAGFRLCTLSPRNIRRRPGEELDFVLDAPSGAICADGGVDLAPSHHLDPFHAAPEVLAGGAAAQSDWWSLGTVILHHVTGGNCFAGIHPSVWRMHVVTSDVPLPDTLPDSIELLLRGLLARDLDRRWQWREIKAWLDGEPVEAPQRGPEYKDHGSAIMLGGISYRSFARYAIAAASDAHWEEARGQFERGELMAWCLENEAGEQCLAGLRRVAAASIDPDLKFGMAAQMRLSRSASRPVRQGGGS